MRILGLDYGSKTVGVAVSDPTGLIATGLEVIRRDREDKLRKTLSRIEELIVEYEWEKSFSAVLLTWTDRAATGSEKRMAFKESLERRTGLPVDFDG